jgi:para-nitrobenzyl esterase
VHGAELLFVFDKLELADPWGTGTGPQLRAVNDPDGRRYHLRDAMMDAWSSFAHSGKPTSAVLPSWPQYTMEHRHTLRLDGTSSLLTDPLGPEVRALLDQLDIGAGS